MSGEWKSGDPIGYISESIPGFEVTAYGGRRYESLVPDTLDLQDRAALAVNGLTGPTDPLADYEMYMWVHLKYNPPMMQHDWSDHCQCKFLEALPLMRIISGSESAAEVDRRWMEVVLHQQGPDGLLYTPVRGRPWALINHAGRVTEEQGGGRDQLIDPVYCGRTLSAMMLYHKRDGGSLWKRAARRLVDGLVELAVDRDGYAYYSPSPHFAYSGSTNDNGPELLIAHQATSRIILGLVHAYREIGYEPAIRLAQKLIRYSLEVIPYYDADGTFLPDQPGYPGWSHFHQHTYVLQSVLEYEMVTGDDEFLDLVQAGYEYGKTNGDVLLGYFPEWLGSEELEHSELCEVADMIALALKMTECGLGDYRDDADRWVRNMFAEGQLTPEKVDWLERYSAPHPVSAVDASYQSTERVVERNVGAFAGWPKANDWWAGVGPGIMHCCTGNATRAIYYVWENMLERQDSALRVNLLMNRPSPWADVESHIPYVGRVDVKVKKPVDLSIRIPEWVKAGDVRVQVDALDRRIDWNGRHAVVGEVKPGDVATMTFPIGERTDAVWVEKEEYTLVRKGNEVVAIDPPGRICPLYQREHYRQDTTRWRQAGRFVSDENIYW